MIEVKNIPSGWKHTSISKETIVVTDYVANGSFASLKENVTYSRSKSYARLIRLTDHNNQYKGEGVYVNKHSFDFLSKSKLAPNDIIISNVGEYSGTVFKVPDLKMPMTLGPNSILVKFKDSQDFMYYFLKSRIGQHLINTVKSGSANPKFNKTEFKKIEFVIPPPEEQRSIASILNAFDDKIELLQGQNKTLEEMARAIFVEWFGKYQLDDELPNGWSVGNLGGVTKTFGGSTPSTTNPDFWNGNISWTSPKDLSNSKGIFLLKTEKKITKEGLKKISSGLLPKKTLLLSSRAPIGYLALTNIELAINQGYIAIVPNQYFSNNFMYLWLIENMKLIENASNGSTFMEISKSSFRNINCVIPSKNILDKFDDLINPLFEKALANSLQIQTLTKTRDELLPRLMNGEIRVKHN